MNSSKSPFFSGRAGNMVFYYLEGRPCMRSLPKSVKQTPSTKARAKEFGEAVRYSMEWREVFEVLEPIKGRRQLMYRMNNIFMQWFRNSGKTTGSIPSDINYSLANFEFNESSRLRDFMRQQPTVDFSQKNKVVVSFPSFVPGTDIAAITGTEVLRWTVTVGGIKVPVKSSERPDNISPVTEIIDMKYNRTPVPAREIELPLKTNKGDLVAVGIKLQFMLNRYNRLVAVEEERWCPAALIGAEYRL